MNQESLDLAQYTLERAARAGSSAAKVDVRREQTVEVSYRDGKLDTLKSASRRELHLSLYVDGKYSRQSTSDLRSSSLAAFITRAVENTRLIEADPHRCLPDPRRYAKITEGELGIFDASYADYPTDARHRYVKELETRCREITGAQAISTSASAWDLWAEDTTVTSNGFAGARLATHFTASVGTTLEDNDRRPGDWCYEERCLREQLPAVDTMARHAAAGAWRQMGAQKQATEVLPIVVDARASATLLHALTSALTASNIQQKRSFLIDRLHQKIGAAALTIRDEPRLQGGAGSRWFDADGFASEPSCPIEGGMLKQYYVDWYYSRKLGWEPTTGSPSNLVVSAGTRTAGDIMKDLGRGLLIRGFIGGNWNLTTGDFSIGIWGNYFENGELTRAFAEMNIADIHLDFWRKLIEVGSDVDRCWNTQTPSFAFEGVAVSGA